MSHVGKNLSSGIPTRSYTKQAVQPQKMARGLKLWMHDVEGLFYLCSKMKGTNQLRLTTQLICAFVFTYAKNRFSCERLICLSSILVENSLTILMKVNFFKEIHKNPNS